nr:MAG TPA: hypothetical protein [Caudoviricetes sp.]
MPPFLKMTRWRLPRPSKTNCERNCIRSLRA